ncbi:unnamed protein product [Amoebophrya sp. A120]|nr:unnamed protein product [Amoebophrya sp. A120]|eukprot:GSA120T00011439001.1
MRALGTALITFFAPCAVSALRLGIGAAGADTVSSAGMRSPGEHESGRHAPDPAEQQGDVEEALLQQNSAAQGPKVPIPRIFGIPRPPEANTCYLNAALQAFLRFPPVFRRLARFCQKDVSQKDENDPAHGFAYSFCQIYSRSVEPGDAGATAVVKAVQEWQKQVFAAKIAIDGKDANGTPRCLDYGEQQESNEIIQRILMEVQKKRNGKTDSLESVFSGLETQKQMRPAKRDPTTGQLIPTASDCVEFSPPQPQHLAIQPNGEVDTLDGQALIGKNFVQSFDTDANTRWKWHENPVCKSETADRTVITEKISSLPPFALTVEVQRTSRHSCTATGSCDKNSSRVALPLQLEIQPEWMVDEDDKSSTKPASSAIYLLRSFTTHLGQGGNAGHYVAYARVAEEEGVESEPHERWFLFDDAKTTALDSIYPVLHSPSTMAEIRYAFYERAPEGYVKRKEPEVPVVPFVPRSERVDRGKIAAAANVPAQKSQVESVVGGAWSLKGLLGFGKQPNPPAPTVTKQIVSRKQKRKRRHGLSWTLSCPKRRRTLDAGKNALMEIAEQSRSREQVGPEGRNNDSPQKEQCKNIAEAEAREQTQQGETEPPDEPQAFVGDGLPPSDGSPGSARKWPSTGPAQGEDFCLERVSTRFSRRKETPSEVLVLETASAEEGSSNVPDTSKKRKQFTSRSTSPIKVCSPFKHLTPVGRARQKMNCKFCGTVSFPLPDAMTGDRRSPAPGSAM